MRYFIDTEFIEAPHFIDLISIGIQAEDGRVYYCESTEVDWSRASQWVLDNVKPHLTQVPAEDLVNIREQVLTFIGDDTAPKFFGYFSDYDWVAFCWLFGSMVDLPTGWPQYCYDLKQLADELGVNPDDFPVQQGDEHHAAADAIWNMQLWQYLLRIAQERGWTISA